MTSDSAGALYYCQSAYAEADEQSAIDATGADFNDLTSGCGGFGWTAMRDVCLLQVHGLTIMEEVTALMLLVGRLTTVPIM